MANAGRVAIVPKGDYSSSTAYKRLDLVRYNDKAYVAKKANTGIVPTNTEYWMLMTSDGIVIDNVLSDDSTNAVQNKVLKSALDSIQTTSRATLSQAGWYRVAEYGADLLGSYANSCEIVLKRFYNKNSPEFYRIELQSTHNGRKFVLLSGKSDSQLFTKIRHTKDNQKCYIEVYYNLDSINSCYFGITSGEDYKGCWQAITPTLTSETVDGVTVTTTYDIPANAKPVTDLDLDDRTLFQAQATGTDLNNCVKTGIYSFVNYATNYVNTPDANAHNGTLFVTETSNGNIVQRYYSLNLNTMYERGRLGNVWTGWQTLATTADLATALKGYLKNTGGTVGGNLTLRATDTATIYEKITNSMRDVSFGITREGKFYIHDNTNDKDIIGSTADNTNTFNGVATGCLALDGGGRVKKAGDTPISVENTIDGAISAYIGFVLNGTSAGFIGFKNGKARVQSTNDAGDILHTGNSAPIVKSTTAPSDTSAVWIDTTNKKTKAYIDGAWTVIA